jgi:hypothetical protein
MLNLSFMKSRSYWTSMDENQICTKISTIFRLETHLHPKYYIQEIKMQTKPVIRYNNFTHILEINA